MSERNIVETTLENLVKREPTYLVDEGVPFLQVPGGWDVQSLEQFLPYPVRLKQEIVFDDVSGFIDYVKEFKSDRSVLFANPRCLTAILDYHGKDDPSWCSHKAVYSLAHTVEWKAWESSQNRQMTQEDFAWFLEEQIATIEAPKAGDLLSVVKQFKATVTSKVVSVLNDNGTTASFEFRKDVNAAGGASSVELPKELTVILKPYDGISGLDEDGHFYRFQVRLKYQLRPDNNGVTFSYAIVGFDRGKKVVFDALVAAVRKAVEVKTFVGGSPK